MKKVNPLLAILAPACFGMGAGLAAAQAPASESISANARATAIVFPKSVCDDDARAIFGLSASDLARLRTDARVTNLQLVRMGPAMVAKTLRKLDSPKNDDPGEAMKWRYMQRADANGKIPHNALLNAKRQRDAMVANKAPTEGAQAAWEWLGPGNIGGRTRSILVNPVDPDVMYAGSVGGGVWKSLDAGGSWAPLTDFLPSIAVSSMVFDPNDPETLYIGTGEGYFNSDSIPGAGIFKSTDGGTTFTQLFATDNPDFDFVNRISFAPGSSTTMLVATNNGIFRSINAGQSFTQENTTRTLDIDYAGANGSIAVAGQENGVVWSNTGGITWNASVGANGGGRVEVAIAPTDASIVYASAQTTGLYQSTNGGQSFTNISSQFYMGNQGWYDNALWIDPTDPNTVIVGGINLWRTRNAGLSWTEISQWQLSPASAHADNHAIVEHPGFNGASNTTVYFGNDGGLYRAANVYGVVGTNGWQELNNNYGVTQFYGGAGNALGTGTLVGGTQDNGTLVYSGATENWITMFGGDGGYGAADRDQLQFLYGETQWGRIHRSDNAGASSVSIYFPTLSDANPGSTNFISPFILDPNGHNRLYVGADRLWRTNSARTESGGSWFVVHDSIGTNHSAIAVADGDSNIVWVGHNNGNVYKSIDGASSWTRMDNNPNALPNRFVTSIAIDPDNHDRVWITFSGFDINNVYLTEDGGATWTTRSGSSGAHLPALPVNSLAIDTLSGSGRIFVGSDLGVFLSEDQGVTWTTDNLGPANTVVDQVFTNTMGGTDYLIAVTHGRGMYRLPLQTIFFNPADLTDDGIVDGSDLAILLSNWGTEFADLNGDGVTNGQDLAILLTNWG